jgi:hypothetical protein
MDSFGNVAEFLLAKVLKIEGKNPANILVHNSGQRNAPGNGNALDTRSDVHSIPEHIRFAHHNFCNVQPNPKVDATLGRCF